MRDLEEFPTQLHETLRHCLIVLLAAIGVTFAGCRDAPPPPAAVNPAQGGISISAVDNGSSTVQFVELTTASGVESVYRNNQEAGHCAILESLGGGAAILDYDQDGEFDLHFPGGGKYESDQTIHGLPSLLYRQTGQWRFDETSTAGRIVEAPYFSHGASAADFNNDGFQDLLITGYGGLLLWLNQGDGTFAEVGRVSGLDSSLWSSSAAWGDVDGDGVLDVYVAHYVNWSFENDPICPGPQRGQREVCSPRQFDPLPDAFYYANGDGTFRNATQDVGLRSDGKGLGVVMADVDLDGHIDVYVGNDTVPNFLYRNDGQGKLIDVALMSGTSLSDRGTPDGSMGVDVGDFNLDGRPDIWVANYEQESFALYRNEGRCSFQHVSQSMGVTAVGGLFVGWGTAFLDFDGDGDEDLVTSNGHVIRYPENAPLCQQPLLLENREGRRFVNLAPAAGGYFTQPHMGRGLAVGDIDSDGDLDLVMVHTNEPAALLSNDSSNDHNWLGLRLIGRHSSREAIGAWAVLTTTKGKELMRQVKGGGSYASTGDRRLFFGLGPARVAGVLVHWPSGTRQTLSDPPLNRYVDVLEPRSEGEER